MNISPCIITAFTYPFTQAVAQDSEVGDGRYERRMLDRGMHAYIEWRKKPSNQELERNIINLMCKQANAKFYFLVEARSRGKNCLPGQLHRETAEKRCKRQTPMKKNETKREIGLLQVNMYTAR